MSSRASPATRAWSRLLPAMLLWVTAQAAAQQQAPPASNPLPADGVTTLDHVQALRPDDEVLDLDTFENPITVDPTRFDKAYDTGITPEEMALKYGGYVNYGINKGLWETWKGIKKVTGMRPYEQPAIARPPPLSEEQMRRAMKAYEPAE
jgi:hypothetical protein